MSYRIIWFRFRFSLCFVQQGITTSYRIIWFSFLFSFCFVQQGFTVGYRIIWFRFLFLFFVVKCISICGVFSMWKGQLARLAVLGKGPFFCLATLTEIWRCMVGLKVVAFQPSQIVLCANHAAVRWSNMHSMWIMSGFFTVCKEKVMQTKQYWKQWIRSANLSPVEYQTQYIVFNLDRISTCKPFTYGIPQHCTNYD